MAFTIQSPSLYIKPYKLDKVFYYLFFKIYIYSLKVCPL